MCLIIGRDELTDYDDEDEDDDSNSADLDERPDLAAELMAKMAKLVSTSFATDEATKMLKVNDTGSRPELRTASALQVRVALYAALCLFTAWAASEYASGPATLQKLETEILSTLRQLVAQHSSSHSSSSQSSSSQRQSRSQSQLHQQRRRKGLCFTCGEAGHLQRECPQRAPSATTAPGVAGAAGPDFRL